MLGAGDVGARIEAGAVPVVSDTWEFVRQDIVPGGTRRNLSSVEAFMDWSEALSPEQRLVLADAQTSGGLLIAVDPSAEQALLADLHARGVRAATRIGTFTATAGRIEVV
jgi:selenide, water dikinase